MRIPRISAAAWKVMRLALMGGGFAVAVIVLMIWLAGRFHPKTPESVRASDEPAIDETAVVEVRRVRVPRSETAMGSVQTVHEVSIASKILARVQEVNVRAGQLVSRGELLVRLDDADLKARLAQAQAGLEAALARLDQARIEKERTERLAEERTASALELERDRTAYREAEANAGRARQVYQEAQVVLEFAMVRSPIDGQVVDRRIEPGDTAAPGQTLVTVFDPKRMQLVASVRESLVQRLSVGQEIGVQIDAIKLRCTGQISEIVPEADASSRTFQVKVTGPCPPGIYAGMFGRIEIPLEDEEVLVIPPAAVRRVGQIDLVEVVQEGRKLRRIVQLGPEHSEGLQVLSGVREGERIAIGSQR